jgi:hypothetical protein
MTVAAAGGSVAEPTADSILAGERVTARALTRPVVLHLLTLAAGVVFLVFLDRRLWFFHDDWDPIIYRRAFHGVFEPHNEHWSTLPILLFRALFSLDGVHHYLVYLLPVLLAHAALAHVMWRVAIRARTGPWIATTAVALFLVDGAGYENLMWAWQIGFVGSTALGWWAVLLATAERPTKRTDAGAILLLIASLMCSGIGVTMTIIAGLAVVLARGWRPALPITIIPAAMQLVWFFSVGYHGFAQMRQLHVSQDPTFFSAFRDLIRFALTGLRNLGDKTFGTSGLGAAALGAVIIWAVFQVRIARRNPAYAAPIAGMLGAVILYLIIAVGRTGMPLGFLAPRYVYVATALLLPGTACALAQLAMRWRLPRLDGCAAAMILAIYLVALLEQGVGLMENYAAQDKQYIAAAIQLVESGGQPLSDGVVLPMGRGYPATAYARLVQDGAMAQPPPPNHDFLISQAAVLQTSLTANPVRPMNGRIQETTDLTLASADKGCFITTPTGPMPQIALAISSVGTSVSLTPSAGGRVVVDLSQPDPEGLFHNEILTEPRKTIFANFDTRLGTARLFLPPGQPTTVCLAGAP